MDASRAARRRLHRPSAHRDREYRLGPDALNAHLTEVAASVKNGVYEAGGIPLELPVVSLGETLLRPTAMLWRNVAAIGHRGDASGQPQLAVSVAVDHTGFAGERQPVLVRSRSYSKEFTLMLSLATSMAATLVTAFTPPWPFAWTAVMSLVTEDMFTIEPPPRIRMAATSDACSPSC